MLQTLACTKSTKIKTLLIKEKAEREKGGITPWEEEEEE